MTRLRYADRRRLMPLVLAIAMIAAVTSGCSRDPQKQRDRYIASGDAYREQNKLREAIIEYRNAVQQDERSVDARRRLAQALTQTGDLGSALREYVRIADLRPDDPDAQVEAGGFLLLGGNFGDAKDRVERALRQDPKHVRAHVLHSGVLAGLKDFSGAVAALDEAIKLAPDRGETYATLGALHMQHGQMTEAETALRRAVELEPSSTPVHLALARFYWMTNRLPDAEAAFQAAVKADASKTTASHAIASFYIATKRVAEAEPYLKTMADAAGTAEARLLLADYYVASKQPAKAEAILTSLADDRSAFSAASVRLAALDTQAGRAPAAEQRLGEVLKREPSNVAALLMSADLLVRQQRLDQALEKVNAALKIDPPDARAYIALGRIHALRQDAPQAIAAYQEALKLQPRNAVVQRELGRLSLASGDLEAATRFSQEAATADPSDVETRLILVRALFAQRDFERADKELQQLETARPDVTAVHVQRAILNALTNKPREARAGFERALALDAANVEALNGLVTLDITARDFKAAIGRADAWLAQQPDNTAALMAAARGYAAAGDYATAERHLRRSLDVNPANLQAYAALGQIYVSQRKLAEALREFDALAGKASKPAAALTMSGTILEMQQRAPEARQRYERAVKADPRAAVAANNLAWLYAESGENLDAALELAQSAVAVMPDSPEILDTLGWVYHKKGLSELAVPHFARAAEKASDKAIYHYHLGLAQLEAGNPERGKAALRRALTAGPDAATAAEIKRLLAKSADR